MKGKKILSEITIAMGMQLCQKTLAHKDTPNCTVSSLCLGPAQVLPDVSWEIPEVFGDGA